MGRRTKRSLGFCLSIVALLAGASADAPARQSIKKSMWGPAQVDGRSQFPVYADLGVGIWQTRIDWDAVAPTRPANPRDPADPAYRWPSELDRAIAEARTYHIRVCLQLSYAPAWANGGHAGH